MFPSVLGTAKCAPYVIELAETTSVRSSTYQCALPKLKVFREKGDDLLERDGVRPSNSPYASQAFLLPKCQENFI
jgi:hypothetical protein